MILELLLLCLLPGALSFFPRAPIPNNYNDTSFITHTCAIGAGRTVTSMKINPDGTADFGEVPAPPPLNTPLVDLIEQYQVCFTMSINRAVLFLKYVSPAFSLFSLQLWPELSSAEGKTVPFLAEGLAAIERSQNPPDCRGPDVKYFLAHSATSGFGSNFHSESDALAMALFFNRVIIRNGPVQETRG